jgi:hypothetical protein
MRRRVEVSQRRHQARVKRRHEAGQRVPHVRPHGVRLLARAPQVLPQVLQRPRVLHLGRCLFRCRCGGAGDSVSESGWLRPGQLGNLLWYRPGLCQCRVRTGYINRQCFSRQSRIYCRSKQFHCRPRPAAQLLTHLRWLRSNRTTTNGR